MADLTGQSFGRYHILEQLGEGGMATVYKAYDTRLERDVAVKVIRTDQFAPAMLAKVLARFEREAKALAKLSHPNIVGVIDYGEHENVPYLVMEYLPGGTLKQRLGKPMPWQEAVRLLIPIAQALDYAHEQGMIHRDVKPSNILMTRRGQPMLTDFGIAKLLDVGDGQTLTGTGVGIGTPEYMAPEQWTNKTVLQSDIYSLGVVFFELVTGHKPYVADTPAAILIKQTNDPLPCPRDLVPDLPETVEKVLFKALAKKVEDRYLNMDELVTALEKLVSGLPASAPQTVATPANNITSREPSGDTRTTDNTPTDANPPPLPAVSQLPATSVTPPIPVPPSTKVNRRLWGMGAGAFMLIILGIYGISKLPLVSAPQPAAIPTLTFTETLTSTPEFTATFTKTSTPKATHTPTVTPPPELGIGSTLQREIDGMIMVFVPAGNFLMGSDPAVDKLADGDEKPQHTVYLDAYWIDQTEVTNAKYTKCVDAGKCTPPTENTSVTHNDYYGNSRYDNFPVIKVDWNQAKAYCEWVGGDLPTEAQWEKAARGTDGRIYPWGNQSPSFDLLNFNYYVGFDTTEVGKYQQGASPYGAYDMAGNVWEWVNDWYDESYYNNSPPSSNPTGPSNGDVRVLRGGSWVSTGYFVRSASRVRNTSDYWPNYFGFRCSRSAASP